MKHPMDHPMGAPRRGNYAVIVALSMSVFLGFSALAVDLSYARLSHDELQNASDSVVRGAVLALDGTDEGMLAAVAAAQEVGGRNVAGGRAVALGTDGVDGTLTLGVWDTDTDTFRPSEDPEEVNAARMEVSMSGMGLGFLSSLGHSAHIATTATAAQLRSGAREADCFLPIAMPSCLLEGAGGMAGIQDIDLVLSPAGVDNIGWSSVAHSPNAASLRDQIEDCESDGTAAVGDDLFLNNGVLTSVLNALADEVERSDTTWDPTLWGDIPEQYDRSAIRASQYGQTLEGVIAVFEDPSYCNGGGGQWNGSVPISGFVYGAVYDVRSNGPAAQKNIRLRVDTTTERDLGAEGGGPNYGVVAEDHVLVQ